MTGSIIAGRPVLVIREQPWPLPPLPKNVTEDAESRSPESSSPSGSQSEFGLTMVTTCPPSFLHPNCLVVGMGCNKGTEVEPLRELLEKTLADNGLALGSVTRLVSHEVKAGELGLVKLANQLGVDYRTESAEELPPRMSRLPPTSSHARSAHECQRGCRAVPGSRAAGPQDQDSRGHLRRRSHPGSWSPLGRRPRARLARSSHPARRRCHPQCHLHSGLCPLRPVRSATWCVRVPQSWPPRWAPREERTQAAIDATRDGRNVAFVCGGDPAIYAMASRRPLEMGTDGIDVEIVPGVTAELAISAILGASAGP